MRLSKHPLLWSALTTTILAGTANAQEAAGATTDPVQEAPAPSSQADAAGESTAGDIVVTGSRVSRKGFEQPTPTTVIGEELLKARGPSTLADAVTLLPALAGSPNPRSVNNSTAGGSAGANLLNLRNLGVNRTLVLLDGRRVVPSTTTGSVDVNLLPSALVSRTEVVTGGASAAYGSDAVAGVVNFILDDRLNGLRGSVQTGITGRGDASSFRSELAYGGSFMDDRLHILLSGSAEKVGEAGPAGARDWYRGYKVIGNQSAAANGQAPLIVLPGVGTSTATDGGLVTAGPLRGTQFLASGAPAPFNFGYVSGQLSVNGDATDNGAFNQLQAPLNNASGFARLAYELTDDVEVFGEFTYGRTATRYYTVPYFRFGNIAVRSDNPYLDAVTRRRMADAGIASFQLGRTNRDLGVVQGYNRRELTRYLGGAKGSLGGFKWDAYYQRGESRILNRIDNNAIVANYNRAVDAVRAPGGGIACRSTLASPGDGCVPLNVFGYPAANAAAVAAYVNGSAQQDITITQDVAAATISGEPFALWAGPVSIAAGAEYRHERYDATADAISAVNGFFVGNYKPSSGSIGVKEGFVEIVAPLLRDVPLIEKLDFNGAVRVTDYNTSGTVTTWKAGLVWDVGGGFRLRGTRSRDIRAPNLNDLYQGGQSNTVTVADSVLGTSYLTQRLLVGNRGLRPERANTYTVGAVYRPDWLRGFAVSADYFNIGIRDAIVVLEAQDVLNGCARGDTTFCGLVTRNDAGLITQIQTPGLNASSDTTAGVDAEMSYRSGLDGLSLPGSISLSLVGTWVDKRTVTVGNVTRDYAGTLSDATALPRWRTLATATYSNGMFVGGLTGRLIGAGRLSDRFDNNGIVDNRVPATFYLDLSASQGIDVGGSRVDMFVAVDNLLDQDPRITPATVGNTPTTTGTNPLIYDVLGRAFRVGLRFRM